MNFTALLEILFGCLPELFMLLGMLNIFHANMLGQQRILFCMYCIKKPSKQTLYLSMNKQLTYNMIILMTKQELIYHFTLKYLFLHF